MNLSGRPTDNPKLHIVSARLNEADFERLAKFCAERGIGISDGMRIILNDYLISKKF